MTRAKQMGNTQKSSLRPKHAADFLGVAKSTLWRWSSDRADFPKPRKLSSRCTVFDAAELLAWRDAQVSEPLDVDATNREV